MVWRFITTQGETIRKKQL